MKISLILNSYRVAFISLLLLGLVSSVWAGPILVVGHKNPDSDSIFSAIALAYLKSQQGTPAIAVAQGKPNPESDFVLSYFGLQAPPVVSTVAGHNVALVDHNTYTQAPDDIKAAQLVEIIDHHNLGGIVTEDPITALIQPVGSTNTIIWELYQRTGISIPHAIAGGMLSAILSDTLAFKSPTTTNLDRRAAQSLAVTASVTDISKFAKQMFLAGEADLKTAPIESLLQRDFKIFDMNGNKVGVGQLAAVSFDLLEQRRDAFVSTMQVLMQKENYQTLVLMLTDIQSDGTVLIVIGKNQQHIADAFNVALKNNSFWVAGVTSRKKQIIPVLSKVFSEHNN